MRDRRVKQLSAHLLCPPACVGCLSWSLRSNAVGMKFFLNVATHNIPSFRACLDWHLITLRSPGICDFIMCRSRAGLTAIIYITLLVPDSSAIQTRTDDWPGICQLCLIACYTCRRGWVWSGRSISSQCVVPGHQGMPAVGSWREEEVLHVSYYQTVSRLQSGSMWRQVALAPTIPH